MVSMWWPATGATSADMGKRRLAAAASRRCSVSEPTRAGTCSTADMRCVGFGMHGQRSMQSSPALAQTMGRSCDFAPSSLGRRVGQFSEFEVSRQALYRRSNHGRPSMSLCCGPHFSPPKLRRHGEATRCTHCTRCTQTAGRALLRH